jgi:hypothetical protein
VNWLRSLQKAIVALLVGLSALLLVVLVASQVAQHILRYRAERLLAEIQSIELRETPWGTARQRLQHWGSAEKLDDHCTSQKCSLAVTLNDPLFALSAHTSILLFLANGTSTCLRN